MVRVFVCLLAVAIPSLAGPADWVPARWDSNDPATLELVRGTAVNCLVLDRGLWSPAFGEKAAEWGVAEATLGACAAAEGVVDAGLRCHGFENLHVCDGSVIPQLPDKHLTLTIMALAHRLAGQLRAARSMPAEATA